MEDLYKEIQERLNFLESIPETDEIKWRKNEIKLVIVTMQQLFLSNMENKNTKETEVPALDLPSVLGNIFEELKLDYRYVNDLANKKSFDYTDGYNDAVRDLIIIVEKQTGVRLKF